MSHSISDYSLNCFLAGTSAREEKLSIVAHLLRGCAACAAKLRAAMVPEVPEDAYEAIFARLTLPASYRPVLRFERAPVVPPRWARRVRRA